MTATTTTDGIDVIIARVEKLWRQANHPGTGDVERQAFEAKALSLMEAHRITEQMLDLGYEDVIGDHFLARLEGRNARLSIDLLNYITTAYDSRVYWKGYGLTYNVYVFGYKSDFERVKLLFTLLDSTVWAQAANEKGYDMAHTKALRRSFVQGFAVAISRRLREAKKLADQDVHEARVSEVEADPDKYEDELLTLMVEDDMTYDEAVQALVKRQTAGTALVFVERGKRVESQYAQKKLRHAAGTRSGGHSDAWSRGRSAGATASLGNKAVSTSRVALSA